MSKLLEIIKKISGKDEEEYVPKQVVDKRLDGLRRLRQVQHNEVEKERLNVEIADFNRERTAKHMFGIKDKLNKAKKSSLIKSIKEKKANILKNQGSILGNLDNEKEEFKKKETNILANHGSFLK